jgi:hypothetical protein
MVLLCRWRVFGIARTKVDDFCRARRLCHRMTRCAVSRAQIHHYCTGDGDKNKTSVHLFDASTRRPRKKFNLIRWLVLVVLFSIS